MQPPGIGSIMNRRSFLIGLGATVIAASVIVPYTRLMPVRGIVMPIDFGLDQVPINALLSCIAVEYARSATRGDVLTSRKSRPYGSRA